MLVSVEGIIFPSTPFLRSRHYLLVTEKFLNILILNDSGKRYFCNGFHYFNGSNANHLFESVSGRVWIPPSHVLPHLMNGSQIFIYNASTWNITALSLSYKPAKTDCSALYENIACFSLKNPPKNRCLNNQLLSIFLSRLPFRCFGLRPFFSMKLFYAKCRAPAPSVTAFPSDSKELRILLQPGRILSFGYVTLAMLSLTTRSCERWRAYGELFLS